MMPGAKIKGLCQTCRHTPSCLFLEHNRSPVAQCEEFDTDGARPVRSEGKTVRAPGSTMVPDASRGGKRRFTGLCTDCENRTSCAFPKPEGGVWHCEEYK